MPQLKLTNDPSPSVFRWEWRTDPLLPEAPSLVSSELRDHTGTIVASWWSQIDWNVTHEAGVALQRTAFEHYLFGEISSWVPVLRREAKEWRRYARTMPLWAEVD